MPILLPPQCIKEPCDSFRGTYKLSDGSTYSGELDGGEPHGYGDLVYPDGNYYEGEFRHGERSGYGFATLDNDSYRGEWEDDRMTGFGTYDFNSVQNSALFPSSRSGLPDILTPHTGRHHAYTNAIKSKMDEIAEELPEHPSPEQIEAAQNQLMQLMDAAKVGLIDGDLPLHANNFGNRATAAQLEAAWIKYLDDFLK